MRRTTIAFFILLFSFKAFAGDSGKLSGEVVDASTNEPLVGATVIVEGTSMGAATDLNGRFVILDVAPGTYALKASAVGYRSEEIKNLQVSIDLTTTAHFKLTESAVTTKSVIVVATRPMVQKDMTATTAIVNSRQIETLPVTSFQDVLNLQAGVVAGHFRGGRSGEVTYMIDGIPVTDPYDGGTVINVNKNAIQQMQLVTGAFNAQYGQAMSGIVNIVTKTGGNHLRGNFTAYSGDFVTSQSNIFAGLQKVNPLNDQWLEASLSGPIVKDKLFFYADARYYYTAGDLFGINKFNVSDVTNTTNPDPYKWTIQETGNGQLVPMAPNLEAYLQGKVTYEPSPELHISYDYMLDNSIGKDYEFVRKYEPNGELSNFTKGYMNTLTLTQTLSSRTYYKLGLSYFFHDYREYYNPSAFSLSSLFQRNDPFNQNYVLPILNQAPEATFFSGGINMAHNIRNSGTFVAKFDITSQITDHHMIKAGLQFNQYELYLHNIDLSHALSSADIGRDPATDGTSPFLLGPLVIPSQDSPFNLQYLHRPQQFSAYVQDKMEYHSLIVNLGVRFDWFHPDGQVLANPADPDVYYPLEPQYQDSVVAPLGNGVTPANQHQIAVQRRMAFWYKTASNKYQFSPRLGVSFPITDRGIIHFSYGLFFQMPSFDELYQSPGYKLQLGGSTFLGVIGNPNMNPEETTKGELGVEQQLTNDLAIDVTGYFNDIRNLSGTLNEIIFVTGNSAEYSKYVNTDFGFVKGIVVTIDKRLSDSWSGTLNYTFQIAKGDASDPNAAANLRASGVQPQTYLIPLDWDQTHTVNATLDYLNPQGWGASFIFSFGSGTPYTPMAVSDIGELAYNSAYKPATYNVDMRLYKTFNFAGGTSLTLFARVDNLFDTMNALQVYTDTGLPNVSLYEESLLASNPPQRIATIQDYYTNPTFYSSPRRIQIGTTISF
jgi:outer membrane receptor protein involved in Fe transport